MMINKDILIVGAGPAGISAAIYLSRSKYSFVLLEKEMVGGKLNTITDIDNYPGFVTISGPELIEKYNDQLKARGIEVTHDNIKKITKENDFFQVVAEKNTYIVKVLIIATGSTTKKSGVPGEKEYQGQGISYCAVCDGFFYRNKDVLVFANESKGYKEALYLEKLVNKLYLVNDNNIDDVDGDLETLKNSKRVDFLYGFSIKGYFGDTFGLSGVILENNKTKDELSINVSGAFPFIGDIPSSYFLNSLNLVMSNGYIDVDNNFETNVKGVYAIGDIVHKSLKQIVTASSDGAIAATSAIRYLNSKK